MKYNNTSVLCLHKPANSQEVQSSVWWVFFSRTLWCHKEKDLWPFSFKMLAPHHLWCLSDLWPLNSYHLIPESKCMFVPNLRKFPWGVTEISHSSHVAFKFSFWPKVERQYAWRMMGCNQWLETVVTLCKVHLTRVTTLLFTYDLNTNTIYHPKWNCMCVLLSCRAALLNIQPSLHTGL